MMAKQIIEQLSHIASKEDFAAHSTELTDTWVAAGVGIEAIESIIRFIEDHGSIDFGSPGALVHFVERYYGKGYEEQLVESVNRKPTTHTILMLNRLINGTKEPRTRRQFIMVLEQAKVNPLADQLTRQQVTNFLERLST